jgi:phosphoribosylamine--glycine ligase
MLFHCGTVKKNELTVTNGGRVIAATSYGQTIKEAVKSSINTLQQLTYDGMYYRTDIGYEFE